MAQQGYGRLVDVGKSLAVVVAAVGRGGEQDLDVGMGELSRHFGCGGERREGNDDGADARCRQHRDDELGPVRVEHADMGSLARSEGDKPAGETGGAAIGLGVVEALGIAHQQRVLAAAQDLIAQHFGDGGLRHVRRRH
jgi:hypothetical protein